MKNIILLLTIFVSINSFSQALNSYQFLVIPAKFDFQKHEDQYGTQSLMVAYFKQKGFDVVQESKGLPTAVNNNRCNAMFVNVTEKSSMFTTKTIVQIKDCNDKILVESAAGISNEKQYDLIYKQAIRMALTSIPEQNYKFSGTVATEKTSFENKQTNTKTEISLKDVAFPKESESKTYLSQNKYQVEVLSNGFLLIDKSTEKVFLKLYKTANPNIFIAKMTENTGIVTKKNDVLVLEYVMDNKLYTEIIEVKL